MEKKREWVKRGAEIPFIPNSVQIYGRHLRRSSKKGVEPGGEQGKRILF